MSKPHGRFILTYMPGACQRARIAFASKDANALRLLMRHLHEAAASATITAQTKAQVLRLATFIEKRIPAEEPKS